MAQNFDILALTRDSKKHNLYYATARYGGITEKYEIYCNIGTKIRYNSPLTITVDDMIPEEGDDLQINVRGVTPEAKRLERRLNDAFIDFALNQ